MLFSIIIPVYNIRSDYLTACIDSLINQTMKDYEILLVDDGSNESCKLLCDEIANKYCDCISVIHKSNEGVSVARNTGIEASKGEYVIFVDPDDWVSSDLCEVIAEIIKKKQFDVLNLSYTVEYKNKSINHEKKSPVAELSNEQKEEFLLRLIDTTSIIDYKYLETEVFGSVWAKCYRTDFLKSNAISFDRKLVKAQDTVFNLYAVEAANTVMDYSKSVYHYRMVSSSITHKYNEKIADIQIEFLSAVLDFIKLKKMPKIFMTAYSHRAFLSYYSILNLDIFNVKNPHNNTNNSKKWRKILKNDVFKVLSDIDSSKYSIKSKLVLLLSDFRMYFLLKAVFRIKRIDKSEEYYE